MKKIKHFTVNLTESQAEQVTKQATKEQRTTTNYLYLIISKHLEGLKNEL